MPTRRSRRQHRSFSLWFVIGLGALLFLTVVFTANVLVVGERLGRVYEGAEVIFYGLIAVLAYLVLVRPLIPVVLADPLPIAGYDRSENWLSRRSQRRLATRLLRRGDLDEQAERRLRTALRGEQPLGPVLREVLSTQVQRANEITREHAQLAFMSTAISQNGSLDAVMLIYTNFKLIHRLTTRTFACRPSYSQLLRMYAQIFTAALVAERLEDMELDELLPGLSASLSGGVAAWVPGLQIAATSILQGTGSAFITLRTGVLTREYLLAGERFDPRTARKSAAQEAVKMLKVVIPQALKKLPSSLKSLLKPLRPFGHEPKPM